MPSVFRISWSCATLRPVFLNKEFCGSGNLINDSQHILTGEQTAMREFGDRLPDQVILDLSGSHDIQDGPWRCRDPESSHGLIIFFAEILSMKHEDRRNLAVPAEFLRNRHVKFSGHGVADVVNTESGIKGIDPLRLAFPVTGPERPKHILVVRLVWEIG